MNPYPTNQDPQCDNCPQRRCCMDVYKQLGQSTGPSITIKIIVAFIVPLFTFIAVLLGAEALLARWIAKGAGRSLLALLIAAVAAAVCIWVIKLLTRRYVDVPANSHTSLDKKHL